LKKKIKSSTSSSHLRGCWEGLKLVGNPLLFSPCEEEILLFILKEGMVLLWLPPFCNIFFFH